MPERFTRAFQRLQEAYEALSGNGKKRATPDEGDEEEPEETPPKKGRGKGHKKPAADRNGGTPAEEAIAAEAKMCGHIVPLQEDEQPEWDAFEYTHKQGGPPDARDQGKKHFYNKMGGSDFDAETEQGWKYQYAQTHCNVNSTGFQKSNFASTKDGGRIAVNNSNWSTLAITFARHENFVHHFAVAWAKAAGDDMGVPISRLSHLSGERLG